MMAKSSVSPTSMMSAMLKALLDKRGLAEAIAAQARKLAYYHSYAGHGNEPAIRLAEMIIARAPKT